jgi:hypothetical protein
MSKKKLDQELNMILYWQTIANVRNVKLQKRYEALAHDLLAITKNQQPSKSKELV